MRGSLKCPMLVLPHDDGPNPGEFSIDWFALNRD
jgi:hypothetical protein